LKHSIDLSLGGSSGSAYHAGSQDPSHVLLAIGRSPELAHTALGLTLGAPTSRRPLDGDGQGHPLTTRRFQIGERQGGKGLAIEKGLLGSTLKPMEAVRPSADS
jgi:hypothetical protein